MGNQKGLEIVTKSGNWIVHNDKKCPMDSKTGRIASIMDPKTLCTLKEAMDFVSRNLPKKYGVGIVLGKIGDKMLCAIDIDDCYDDEGNIYPEVRQLIDYMDTYAEKSVSGRGVHIYFFAKKKGVKCKNINLSFCKALELYGESRYMAFTGDRLNDKDIEDRQAECDYIYDKYFGESNLPEVPIAEKKVEEQSLHKSDISDDYFFQKALKEDKKFQKYWNGYRKSTDESSNDMALMSKLMFLFDNNHDKAIEKFKSSPYAKLKGSKHTIKMNRADYLLRTANNCRRTKTAKDCYNKKKPPQKVILNKLVSLNNKIFKYCNDDKGYSELFRLLFGRFFKYDVTSNSWIYFNKKYWVYDKSSIQVSRLMKVIKDALDKYSKSPDLYMLNASQGSIKSIEDFQKQIKRLGSRRVRESIIQDAQCECPTDKNLFDTDKYLLNCINGTLNLKTFELYNHKASDLITKITCVEYKPGVKSDLWEKFIFDIMEGNLEKIKYLQKCMGYALTGDTSCETIFILYGATTRNGKSTLIETIMYMLGYTKGYAAQANPESLALKNRDSGTANGDIARLDGVRFLNVSETTKKMVLDVALIKSLTGRDTITARHLYEKEFQFTPVFKLFMNTNYLPRITDPTIFSSGRINVIRFNRHFEENEQDKTLKDKLREPSNLSGILNWCLEGLDLYYKEGLEPPQIIKDETLKYKEDNDNIGNFISDSLIKDPESNLSGKEVYIVYKKWCADNNYMPEGLRNFYSDLRTKNLLKDSATVNKLSVRNVVCGYKFSNDYNYRMTSEDISDFV